MILQSLANLAAREGLAANPSFEIREVCWVINLKKDGRFISLESLLQPADSQQAKGRPRGQKVRVPRQTGRTSGDQAELLVDKAEYVLGFGERDAKKLHSRSALFVREIKKAFKATKDEGVRAVYAFLTSPKELATARAEASRRAAEKDERLEGTHLIAFRLDRDTERFVHLRAGVGSYVSRFVEGAFGSGRSGQCLVTGAETALARKYPVVKNIPPVRVTKGGVHITAVDDGSSAYHSYGWAGNDNSPISIGAGFAFADALNRLLDSSFPNPRDPNVNLPEQRVLLGENTVAVFWTDEPSRVPAAIVPAIAEGNPEAARELGTVWDIDGTYGALADEPEQAPDASPLRDAHDAPWKGIPPRELDDPGAFRLLILSGGQGRATVRAFHTTQVSETVKAVRRWFEDIRLSTLRNKRALRPLLRSLAVRGNEEKLPPTLAGDVFLAILSGRALPRSVLEMAVRRCRSEANSEERNGRLVRNLKVPYERAALIKAYLNRARQSLHTTQGIHFEELRPAMNEHERNKGYLLGRMFACIEWMQELALGDVGATVTDRYFSAACATPQAVFPRLLKTEVHHYRKAREGQRGGSARWLHGQISQLATWLIGQQNAMQDGEVLDAFLRRSAGRPLAGFPAFLPLPEQGLFTLGYHQQRAERFRKREDAAAPAAEAEAN